ncbi:lytic transglycosylase domain-containing protein [Elongatibacter sediminis]|uniref:Lytic transglycosylase domain-containing protein n=1 Tax=Elongatibacter sediminis TaxID=3119006 RepID=A0AAW9RBX4_9GAMM
MVLLLCAVVVSFPVRAQVYKYVDEDGIVTFTNIAPPEDHAYETLRFPCYASDPRCRGVSWEKVALNTRAFREEIHGAALRNGLEESLIRAIIHAESAYQPEAVSPKGAQGLMQLMPETQRSLAVSNPFDPADNIEGGARHLSELLEAFGGDSTLAAAAYNAGAGAVQKHGGVPPFEETREYVRRVNILYRRYRQAGG